MTTDPRMPQDGDTVWTGRYYRKIITVDGMMDDGRVKVHAFDPYEDRIIAMALTLPEPVEKRHARRRPGRDDLPRLTPELRTAIANKTQCRRGHDLTATMPSGKPVLWIGPKGQEACRMCQQESIARRKATE